MRRLARVFLIAAAVLAVLGLGALWYLDRWLKSPETKALVEQELRKALKMPLTFQALDISPWGGVRAEGVSIQDGGTQFFESSSFVAKHRITPLLSGRFVFSEITIDTPRFVVVQRPDGSWRLPQLPEEKKQEQEKPAADKPKVAGTPKPASKPKESRVLIERLKITNGQADFYDKDHKPVATASGIQIALKDVSEHTVEGRVRADRLAWMGGFGITDFDAGVSNSKEKGLIIPNFSAKAGGGTITGGFARKPEKPVKYSAKVTLTEVELGAAIAAGDVPAPNISGLLSGAIEVRGTGNDTKQMSGKAKLTFRNGSCREIEMVRTYGELANLEEVANFSIPSATADVVIWNGRLNIKPLAVSAPPLALSANGTAKLDGKLDLEATLLADASYLNRNPVIATQFGPADANGMRSLAFNVTGSLTKPKHNLQERITGTKDKDRQRAIMIGAGVDRFLQNIAPPPAGNAEAKP